MIPVLDWSLHYLQATKNFSLFMVESDFGCSSASLISMSIYLMPCFDNLAFCAVICAEVALVAKLMPHSPFKACPGLFSKFC